MYEDFRPDWRLLADSARNIEVARTPLYEHNISVEMMERVLGYPFGGLFGGDYDDKLAFFDSYCEFCRVCGYDCVTFEQCIGPAMPGSGALGGHIQGVIRNRADFERYPWDEIPDRYFAMTSDSFRALRECMPPGMMAVGGVGNGVFELAQDLVGYMDLCYMREDDPALYEALFRRIGRVMLEIWERFLAKFGDIYCVLRFGDDLGFKSNTLIPPEDIRTLVIPAYRPIIDAVHRAGKPFLLHSCGAIDSVMEDLIAAGIDAKHSNEDQIAPFQHWVDAYGDRIGNFGGIDMDCVCRLDRASMRDYITEVVAGARGHGGFAFGTGNSIPAYVPVEGYLNMIEIFREMRGETK